MSQLNITSEVFRLTTSLAESTTSLSSGTQRDLSMASRCMRSLTAISGMKAMEHQTLKVPYEILNKKFRSAQKNIDREISHVQMSVNDLEKAVQNWSETPITIGAINELLDGVFSKLLILKRKSNESWR